MYLQHINKPTWQVSCTYPKTTRVPFCSVLFPELDRMQANAAVTRLLQPIFLDRPPYLALSSFFNPGTRSLQVYCCLPYTFPCISRFSMLFCFDARCQNYPIFLYAILLLDNKPPYPYLVSILHLDLFISGVLRLHRCAHRPCPYTFN